MFETGLRIRHKSVPYVTRPVREGRPTQVSVGTRAGIAVP